MSVNWVSRFSYLAHRADGYNGSYAAYTVVCAEWSVMVLGTFK